VSESDAVMPLSPPDSWVAELQQSRIRQI